MLFFEKSDLADRRKMKSLNNETRQTSQERSKPQADLKDSQDLAAFGNFSAKKASFSEITSEPFLKKSSIILFIWLNEHHTTLGTFLDIFSTTPGHAGSGLI